MLIPAQMPAKIKLFSGDCRRGTFVWRISRLNTLRFDSAAEDGVNRYAKQI